MKLKVRLPWTLGPLPVAFLVPLVSHLWTHRQRLLTESLKLGEESWAWRRQFTQQSSGEAGFGTQPPATELFRDQGILVAHSSHSQLAFAADTVVPVTADPFKWKPGLFIPAGGWGNEFQLHSLGTIAGPCVVN